jgi:glycosyltransferase involved in cell wall biosynthesis
MKIVIIGPGIMPIPPAGWGAVEILIWDYKETLESLGHDVVIINNPNRSQIVEEANNTNADFIHIQYDEFIDLAPHLKTRNGAKPNVACTSHYGYLDQPNKYGGYRGIFNRFINSDCKIFALSTTIASRYIDAGINPDKVFVVPNGVRGDLFRFDVDCQRPSDSIYLAKVDFRKRQFMFHNIPDLYFAGNIADHRYNKNNYLGEWDKKYLYQNLTTFSNLVLLSDGEAHPLVCLEAMSAGLGLVISEWSTANLDTSLPFISVVPESKINNIPYIEKTIKENSAISISMREDIRKYAVENFSWEHIINSFYLPAISV